MKIEICERYCGGYCVDGSCPIANREKYEEYDIPLISDCKECSLRRGCENCVFFDTDICIKNEEKE